MLALSTQKETGVISLTQKIWEGYVNILSHDVYLSVAAVQRQVTTPVLSIASKTFSCSDDGLLERVLFCLGKACFVSQPLEGALGFLAKCKRAETIRGVRHAQPLTATFSEKVAVALLLKLNVAPSAL